MEAMMALTQQQRDEKRRAKAERLQEEDLRLKVRPGTKQALLELMEWAGIEEQGEAMTLMIHHLHGLGPGGALPLLTPPRHEITVSPSVARRLDNFREREQIRALIELS
jgi:predicted component of type VI protein secretion system